MIRYFKTPLEYFNFISKNKEKIEVLKVKSLKTKIKVNYERKKA